MQKADTVLGQVREEWCPSPGTEESLGMDSTADWQAALCLGGVVQIGAMGSILLLRHRFHWVLMSGRQQYEHGE